MKNELKWEKIGGEVLRARVFGGWIVYTENISSETGDSTSCSMVFVPDPNHEWEM